MPAVAALTVRRLPRPLKLLRSNSSVASASRILSARLGPSRTRAAVLDRLSRRRRANGGGGFEASFDNASIAWSADLGGAVRGQALVFGGRVVAATENNRVVALDPQSGAVLWSASLGRPLTDVQSVAAAAT